MPWIQYVGPLDEVYVPRWQIPDTKRMTPIEVSQEAADDLTLQEGVWAAMGVVWPPPETPAPAAPATTSKRK